MNFTGSVKTEMVRVAKSMKRMRKIRKMRRYEDFDYN